MPKDSTFAWCDISVIPGFIKVMMPTKKVIVLLFI